MKLIFWTSLFLIVYAYIGYPVLLYIVHWFVKKDKPLNVDSRYPKVSVLISAYNEEESIENKLINTLELDYPSDLLEVIAISDGSTDRTDSIIQKFAHRGVMLKHYEGRIGKTECLNRTIPTVSDEIIIFSDANALYAKGAIKSLAGCFASNDIGFVTGHTRYQGSSDSGSHASAGVYTRIESWTKKLESVVGTCVSADGAIFAIRKDLYKPLQDYDINDFVIPLKIIAQGYRGILAQDAFCYENASRSSGGEFARQVRIANRTLRAIWNHRSLINPFNRSLVSFQLISHKLLKFFVPFVLMVVFLSNVHLAFGTPDPLYIGTLLVQIFFYLVALINIPAVKLLGMAKISEICRSFVMVNWAIVHGWIQFLRGKTYTTWNPTR